MRLSLLALLLPLAAQAQDSRQELNLGVAAFKNAQYPEAIEHFSAAVKLDPNFTTANLYLGTAYMAQFIPGADAPDNLRLAELAQDAFQRALDLDPENEVAIASIASLLYNRKKFDDAKLWYQKATAVNPNNKEAWYTLGVIAWSQFYPVYRRTRAKLDMKPEEPGPIPDSQVRQELKIQYGPIIDEGLRNLEKALSIDPKYDDAMAYMNLLIRERADLAESQAEYRDGIRTADDWVQKALETKKRNAESRPARP